MNIYQQEYDDAISDKISANASVAYISAAQPCLKEDIDVAKASIENDQAIAALNDEDLYYVQSILVSSSWNRNDDIFDKAEVWNAKSTPEDKPTNLEHDEGQIVGHIVSNWPINTAGDTLPDNIEMDSIPEKFHIVTGSVIYRNFSNPELKERAEALIQEIENGTKYVSMECYFNDFDYGLLNKETGEYSILERTNTSAYLSKHLRAYGGLGEFDNFKIGRVLRNINFSGKGFVDKPANPESIIFDSETSEKVLNKNIPLENNSVSNIQASLNMENTNMSVEKDIADLKDKVEAMNGCGEVLKEAYSRVSELEAKVMDLEATMKQEHEDKEKKDKEMAELATVLDAKDKELEEYKSKMEYDVAQLDETKATEIQELSTTHDEALKTVQTELASANEAIEAYKAQEVEIARQAKIASRISSLVENGVTAEVAEATVAKFEELDDEAFATIASLVGSNTPEWAQSQKEEVEAETEAEASAEVEVEAEAEDTEASEEKTESTVSEEVLEDVEAEKTVDLSVGSEDDSELESARASLVDFVYSRLGKEQTNKEGE
jgi:hypothetical protein